jgi:hypothetical protein
MSVSYQYSVSVNYVFFTSFIIVPCVCAIEVFIKRGIVILCVAVSCLLLLHVHGNNITTGCGTCVYVNCN